MCRKLREVLCWYDRQGNRYQTTEELAVAAQQQLIAQQQQLEAQQRLLERYRQQFGDLPEG